MCLQTVGMVLEQTHSGTKQVAWGVVHYLTQAAFVDGNQCITGYFLVTKINGVVHRFFTVLVLHNY